jgi:hypothetical protein
MAPPNTSIELPYYLQQNINNLSINETTWRTQRIMEGPTSGCSSSVSGTIDELI